VHRLDVETSGVVAIARTVAAARFYKMALENRAFEKTYLCVVEGEAPLALGFTVSTLPLGFDRGYER
jgi:23S rRNA-/tRNA-specific pseudouridylate synthase